MTQGPQALQFVLSFAFVLGLMWAVARVFRKQVTGRNTGGLEVIARQPLSRTSSIAVVRVGEQAYVVGVTEQRIALLGEADAALLESLITRAPAAAPRAGGRRRRGANAVRHDGAPVEAPAAEPVVQDAAVPAPRRPVAATATALHGSILAPSTWRQALEVVRERTVRKG